MSEYTVIVKNSVRDYSEELIRLIKDISEELNNGIVDGFSYKIANMKDNETEIFSFLKDQGYKIKYKEFLSFISDSKEMISANENLIDEVSREEISEELSDDDLENVAGGKGWWKKNWKKVAIGVGIAVVVGAALIATGGIGAVVVGALAAGSPMGVSGLVVAGVAATGGLATGCAIAGVVGAGSIAAGVIGNIFD